MLWRHEPFLQPLRTSLRDYLKTQEQTEYHHKILFDVLPPPLLPGQSMAVELELGMKHLAKLRQLAKPLRVDVGLEGFHEFTFGGRAGPSSEPSNVIHEMSHFVEIDDKRCTANGWGFKYGTWIDCPILNAGGYQESRTDHAIRREMRVWAIQAQLMLHWEILDDDSPTELSKLITELTRPVTWMDSFFWLICPGKPEEAKMRYVAEETLKLTEIYPLKRILPELRRKQELVRRQLCRKFVTLPGVQERRQPKDH